jgi:hypothetical protein
MAGHIRQPKPAGRSDEKRADAGINGGDEAAGAVLRIAAILVVKQKRRTQASSRDRYI